MLNASREETLRLKSTLNEEQERSKRLNTKVMRLTEELKKAKAAQGQPTRVTVSSIESQDRMDELGAQISALQRANTHMKGQLVQYKTALDSVTRKKSMYGGVSSRLSTQIPRQHVPLMHGKQPPVASPRQDLQADQVSHNEEVGRLQTLVNVLRERLVEAEKSNEQLKADIQTLKTVEYGELQTNLLKSDAERVSLQQTLHDKELALSKLTAENEQLRRRTGTSEELVQNSSTLAKSLEAQLAQERHKVLGMQEQLAALQSGMANESRLQALIEDLQTENEHLRSEQSRLLATTFNHRVFQDHDRQVQALNERIKVLETEAGAALSREQSLLADLDSARESEKRSNAESALLRSKLTSLEAECANVQQRLDLLAGAGISDVAELEEAIRFIKARRQRGLIVDMNIIDDAERTEKIMKRVAELEVELASCVEDLDATRIVLSTQQTANQRLKEEVALGQKCILKLKDDYELKLENMARQLDGKRQHIARIEGRLQDLVGGRTDVRLPDGASDRPLFGGDHDQAQGGFATELLHGQNMLEIQVVGAQFTDAAVQSMKAAVASSASQPAMIYSKSMDFADPAHRLTTFVSFDFFDFATQVSPLGLGLQPKYNFTSYHKVTANDFFIEFLQTQSMKFEVYRSVGEDFWIVGAVKCWFNDLTERSGDVAARLHYVGEIVAEDGTPLGQLTYSLKLHVPLVDSMKAYHDRTSTLNLIRQASADDVRSKPSKQSTVINATPTATEPVKNEEAEHQIKDRLTDTNVAESAGTQEEVPEIEVPEAKSAYEVVIDTKYDDISKTTAAVAPDKQQTDGDILNKEPEVTLQDNTSFINDESKVGQETGVAQNLQNAPSMPDDGGATRVFKVTLQSLQIPSPSHEPLAQSLQQALRITQFFCTFEFLDYPGDELESESIRFPELSSETDRSDIEINFSRAFDFKDNLSEDNLRHLVNTPNAEIKVVLVSEPAVDMEDQGVQCVDFAVATVKFADFLNDIGDDEKTVVIPVYPNVQDETIQKLVEPGSARFGQLTIRLGGLRFLRSLYTINEEMTGKETRDLRDLRSGSVQDESVVSSLPTLSAPHSPQARRQRSNSLDAAVVVSPVTVQLKEPQSSTNSIVPASSASIRVQTSAQQLPPPSPTRSLSTVMAPRGSASLLSPKLKITPSAHMSGSQAQLPISGSFARLSGAGSPSAMMFGSHSQLGSSSLLSSSRHRNAEGVGSRSILNDVQHGNGGDSMLTSKTAGKPTRPSSPLSRQDSNDSIEELAGNMFSSGTKRS